MIHSLLRAHTHSIVVEDLALAGRGKVRQLLVLLLCGGFWDRLLALLDWIFILKLLSSRVFCEDSYPFSLDIWTTLLVLYFFNTLSTKVCAWGSLLLGWSVWLFWCFLLWTWSLVTMSLDLTLTCRLLWRVTLLWLLLIEATNSLGPWQLIHLYNEHSVVLILTNYICLRDVIGLICDTVNLYALIGCEFVFGRHNSAKAGFSLMDLGCFFNQLCLLIVDQGWSYEGLHRWVGLDLRLLAWNCLWGQRILSWQFKRATECIRGGWKLWYNIYAFADLVLEICCLQGEGLERCLCAGTLAACI